jgi:hypothetical protein
MPENFFSFKIFILPPIFRPLESALLRWLHQSLLLPPAHSPASYAARDSNRTFGWNDWQNVRICGVLAEFVNGHVPNTFEDISLIFLVNSAGFEKVRF